MDSADKLGLLLLHALPLDGSMWAAQMALLPGSTYAPTLYRFGNSIEAWAHAALRQAQPDRLIVVGCSAGGSCALEVAAAAPDRVAAMVLIGTKARHRPDPTLHAFALKVIQEKGLEEAWRMFWRPLFSSAASGQAIDDARRIALLQPSHDIARGVTAFHSRPSRDRFLSEFPRPVIIVSGEDDSAPGPQTSAAQVKLARYGRLHVIPGCGHYVPLERPHVLNSILGQVIAAAQ